jgi:choline dehydrogenase
MDETDYIIVGAGSAGCALANRLTENGKHRVTLIEAGGTDRRFFVQMPLGYGKLFYNPAVNWMYQAEPDPGLNGQRDHIPRGRILGGSSSHQCHGLDPRPPRRLRRLGPRRPRLGLGRHPARLQGDRGQRGRRRRLARHRAGRLYISRNRKGLHWLVEDFIAACGEAGLPYNPDFNGAAQEGAGTYQMTIKGRRRNSAARAFLRPAMRRSNLQVITGAQVTRPLRWAPRHRRRIPARRPAPPCAQGPRSSSAAARSTRRNFCMLSGIGLGALFRPGPAGPGRQPQCRQHHMTDHHGINYTWKMKVPTYNNILRPWFGKALMGLWYLAPARRRPAGQVDQPRRRLLPHPARPRPPEHAALLPGLLDASAQGRRTPAADPRPVPRPLHRPVELPPHLARPCPADLARSAGAARDRRQRLLDARGCRRRCWLAVKFLRTIAAQPSFARWVEEELRPGPQVQATPT